MLVLPIVLLIKLKGKQRLRLFLALAAVGVICVMHVINGLRVGNYMLATDVAYMVRVAQMPVMAICFIFCMDDDSKMRQAERGCGYRARDTAHLGAHRHGKLDLC